MYYSLSTATAALSFFAAANAQLNISALLAGLGPAPAGDPRFTDFQPPGPGDGTHVADVCLFVELMGSSSLALPWPKHPRQPWIHQP